MKLTKSQVGLFWSVFQKAVKNMGLDQPQADLFRHKLLKEEAGVEHLADLDGGEEFESVMIQLAYRADDYDLANRFAGNETRRYWFIILKKAREILSSSEDKSAMDPELYVAGILFQSRLIHRPWETTQTLAEKLKTENEWETLSVYTLRVLLQIVATEVNRIRKRATS